MPQLKKPTLPPGPLADLNAALHDLHRRAGMPSMRELAQQVGTAVASKSRVHDAFASSRLPSWGLVQLITECMVAKVPGGDAPGEEKRLYNLWLAASGSPRPQALQEGHPFNSSGDELKEVLAIRIGWVKPGSVGIDIRRRLKVYIDHALSDCQYPERGRFRIDGLADTVLMLEVSNERQDSPSLMVATILASLDDSASANVRRHGIANGYIYMVAIKQRVPLNAQSLPPDALATLDTLWNLTPISEGSPTDNGVSAAVSDSIYDKADFSWTTRGQDEWDALGNEDPFALPSLQWVEMKKQNIPALRNHKLMIRKPRVSGTPPF